MRSPDQRSIPIDILTVLTARSGGLLGLVLGTACLVSPASAQEVVYEEVSGLSVQKSVVNFAELALQEQISTPHVELVDIPSGPIPHNLPVDWDQVIAFDETERVSTSHGATPLPCSPAPADTFQALDDPTGQNGPFCGENNCTDGVDNNGNGQIDESTAVIPPDTHGAVGPNHVMTVLNTQVLVQNRSGTIIGTPVTLAGFWSSLNNPVPFDPKVVYDPFQNRWIFTAMSNACTGASSVLIGASQTNDPTGNWNLFRIDADANNATWVDYPSIGFNRDWVAVSVIIFSIGNFGNCVSACGCFVRGDVFIFNKLNLYANQLTFTRWQGAAFDGAVQVPALTYDNTLNELYLLQTFNGNSCSCCPPCSPPPVCTGFLRLYAITGVPPANPTLNPVGFIPTNQTWDAWIDNNNNGVWDNQAPQCGANQFHPANNGMVTNDQRMQNVVYRNGSLWGAHMVYLPASQACQQGTATRTSVQWWEITPSTNPNQVVMQQRALLDNPPFHHAFPTLSVNQNDDVLIGYTRFSATQFASSAYSFRASNDMTNTLRPSFMFKTGEAPYFKILGGVMNRWGDYSHTVVDPANDTDFWTIQEYADTPHGWTVPFLNADRWATQWAVIGPAAASTCPFGFDWAQVSLNAPAVTSMTGHDMVFDSGTGRNRIVLYRGDISPGGTNHRTWEWDGCRWLVRTPSTTPGGREGHCMAYDSQPGRTVLFGGWRPICPQDNTLGDTWEYNGNNWSLMSGGGGANDPPQRISAGMAYDSNRDVTVMFGGTQIAGCDAVISYSDTWEWNGSSWAQKFPSTVPGNFDGLSAPAMAYDPVRQVTVLHGGEGYGGAGDLDETWEWDGMSWTQQFPNNTPGPRSGHDMAFDATRGVMVLYGGGFNDDDLWEWNGSDWNQVAAASTAGGRVVPRLAYDITRRQMVLFEGRPNPANNLPETFTIPNRARAFCLSGTSSGAGWSWCIAGAGFEVCDLNVAGVMSGSNASALAAQFVTSIDGAACGGLDAAVTATSPQCFTVSVAGGEDFNLLVGSALQAPTCCMVTGSDCSFNPEITEVALAGSDCNGNFTDDAIDLEGGVGFDFNANGVPDECEGFCLADLNGDGVINASDLALLLGAWGPNPGHPSDINDDGVVGPNDLALLLGHWGPCPETPVDPCGPDAGDCCVPHGPGCNDATCCQLICSKVPYCCEVQWDPKCAAIAAAFCDPAACASCCEAHPSPGCSDSSCEEVVCAFEPSCCKVEWEQFCADMANGSCKVCGVP